MILGNACRPQAQVWRTYDAFLSLRPPDMCTTGRRRTHGQAVLNHNMRDMSTTARSGLRAAMVEYGGIGQQLGQFTGKERDSETGLDYFGARYLSSAMGRFTSPDIPLIDQLAEDPQSWNLYAYVRNNPLIYADPTGNDCVYVNSSGDGIDSIDNEIDSKGCGKAGGYWVDGTVTQARFAHGSLQLIGTTDGKNKTSASYALGPDPGLMTLQTGMMMAEPGVNAAGHGLMIFGAMVAPVPMVLAQCGSGWDCSAAGVGMALLPEIAALKAGGTVMRLARATGKGAEKIQKSGGLAQAAADFAAVGGKETINGAVRIRELSDGTRVVLYTATSTKEATIAIQKGGQTLTKIRY